MRIISGSARGKKLESLQVSALRPMLDRVKESLFNILREAVVDVCVLDLFSGAGGLGLEALSRGADWCTFVERDGRLADLVRRNAEACRVADRCVVLQRDALALAGAMPPGGRPVDVVFADPPYDMVDDPNARAQLFAALEGLIGAWARPGALVVLHHRPMPYALWPGARLAEVDHRIYGQSQLTFFRADAEADDG